MVYSVTSQYTVTNTVNGFNTAASLYGVKEENGHSRFQFLYGGMSCDRASGMMFSEPFTADVKAEEIATELRPGSDFQIYKGFTSIHTHLTMSHGPNQSQGLVLDDGVIHLTGTKFEERNPSGVRNHQDPSAENSSNTQPAAAEGEDIGFMSFSNAL